MADALRFATGFNPLIVLASLACQHGPPAERTATVRDSAGITIVDNDGVDRPPPWSLRQIATIGGADTGVENLGRLDYSTVGTDTLGHVFIVSDAELHVVVVDSAGRYLRTIGRKGGGPGELQALGSMFVEPSGAVAIQDYRKMALVRFGFDGSTEPEASLARLLGLFYGVIRLTGDTLLLHGQSDLGPEPAEKLLAITQSDTTTLASLVQVPPNGELNACNRYRMRALPRIFSPQMNWTTGGGSVVVNTTATYQVDIHRANHLVRRIRRAIMPAAATTAMIKRLYPAGRRYGGKECIVFADQIERDVGAADVIPAIQGVAIDQEGRLWVGRYTFPDEPPRTDVFSATGAYLGTFNGIGTPLGFPARGLVVTASVDSTTDVGRLVVNRLVER